MKKYLIGFILGGALAISVSAISEDKMEIRTFQTTCVTLNYLNKIAEQYDELPILRADSVRKDDGEDVSYVAVLYMNMKTKSWTLVEKISDNSYCVMGVGNGMEPVSQDIRDSIQKGRKN